MGTVKDATAGVLPGATVEVRSRDTGASRVVTTEGAGTYRVAGLAPGLYTVEVSLDGFGTSRMSDVQLRVAETRTLDVVMQIANTETVIEVRELAPIADRSSAAQGMVVSSAELNKVPVNGRDWSAYMLLAPGAVDSGGGSQRSIRFMGRSKDDNNYVFDGIDATGVKEGPHLTALRTVISNDSIAEFRVTAGVFTAEYGNSIGGVVSLVSKSGTSQYHGGAFEYHRNSAFDAKRFIDARKPDFTMHQFGGNLGGPLVTGRTFFFVNYEGLQQSQERSFIGFVPSASFRQRVLAASPALQPVIAAFPAGVATSNPDIDQYSAIFNTIQDENSVMARFDHRFTNNTSAYLRYNVADGVIATPGSVFGDVNNALLTTQNAVFQLQSVRSSLVNEAKLGYNRSSNSRDVRGSLRERINVPGFTSVPGSSNGADPGTSWSLVENLTLLRGRHTVKTGVEVRRNQIDISQGDSFTVTYANRDAFVANRVDTVALNGAFSPRIVRTDTYAGYVLDEWKLTPNVTLNAGLRYEYYAPLHERDGRQRIYDRPGCGGICPSGSETYFPDRNNVGPRLSLAWSPEASGGKTVVRVGGGVYHQQGQLDDLLGPIESDNRRTSLTAREIPQLTYPVDPFLSLGSATFDAPRALLRDRKDFESYQFGAFLAQELPGGFATQIGYLTNQGRHILERTFDNAIDPATGQRPLPNFGLIDIKYDGGRTSFHGLQASVQRRYQQGLVFNAQYQLGHAQDQGAVGSNEANYPQDLNCRECEWADGNFDVRHQFTTSWIYELPLGDGAFSSGWEVSGLFTARTGMPINVLVTRPTTAVPDGYVLAFSSSTQRPNLVPGVNPIPDKQTRDNWLNLAAFAVPANGTRGNLPRNAFRGPGLVQLDTALSKRFSLGSAQGITARVEIFNVLNTDQLGRPNTNISSPADFGRITTVLNPGATGSGTSRQVQFMLRYDF
jgi:outer membrane receptor protein involved in Fe transport